MKFLLILAFVVDGGFVPQAQSFDTLPECEAARKKAVAVVVKEPGLQFIVACLRVRSSSEKEV